MVARPSIQNLARQMHNHLFIDHSLMGPRHTNMRAHTHTHTQTHTPEKKLFN